MFEEAERGMSATIINRKPLPQAPVADRPANLRPPLAPKGYPQDQSSCLAIGPDVQRSRYVARGHDTHISAVAEGKTSTSIARKPVGPRPFDSRPQSMDLPMIQGSQSHTMVENDEQRPRRRTAPPGKMHHATEQNKHDKHDPVKGRSSGEVHTAGVVITVIRRDAASGCQWNVGTITRTTSPLSGSESAIRVEINTPGYRKFAKPKDPGSPPPPSPVPTDSDTIRDRIPSLELGASTASNPSASTLLFTRQIDCPLPRQLFRHKGNHDQSSSETPPAPDTSSASPSLGSTAHRIRNYIFASPWQGSCTFTTGMDGRSLKCRHSLPTTDPTNASSTATVAEVRFNLPWRSLRGKNTKSVARSGNLGPGQVTRASVAGLFGPEMRQSWRRDAQRTRDKASSSSSSSGLNWDSSAFEVEGRPPRKLRSDTRGLSAEAEEDGEGDDGLDLTLGREKAGGGVRGRSAKLGKLVIEDEGLKMCDLVVAVCMGIWWGVYEGWT